ncbi:MAG: altronate dehydratase [Anaerolineae bacterium]|nr:altronate dehydratase [Anaerolineae bacterium]
MHTPIELTELPPAGPVALHAVALRLTAQDNVAVARVALRQGMTLLVEDGTAIPVRQFIPGGHKVALSDLAPDAPVLRYGQIIGFASQPIEAGAHVHTHNVMIKPVEHAVSAGVNPPVTPILATQRRTFLGYRREDGRVGTRNTIAVIATVNCAAHTCHEIAAHFTPERLRPYPHVDGVIPIMHTMGCTDRVGGQNYVLLQRTLAGIARHANVAGCVLVGLGCEVNQVSELAANHALAGERAATLSIQELGGVRKTVAAGIAAVERLLPLANACPRSEQPASALTLALQCGGSDSWSGVTANPLIGRVTDALVRQGGSAVLGETPEIYGAEHLLMQRAAHPDLVQRLQDKIAWWQEYTARFGLTINNNPSTGNKAGGLTTIYEKSLGAVAKGGTSPLVAVYDYAAPVKAQGLSFMDTPGYDPVGVTGQVAGGCNLVLFSTGRGSVFGFAPAPSLKIATHSARFAHMIDDMDFNAGRILDGEDPQAVAADLFELVLAVASGQRTKSEAQGIGSAEFVPWQVAGII